MATFCLYGELMAKRRKLFPKEIVIRMRFDEPTYSRVRDIAALETAQGGKVITATELIRQAVNFVYEDNERLRECFRRMRSGPMKKRLN
jgi:hypothetical protein